MSRVCVIGARAGSKGLKNKNLRQLLDKPLVAHTVAQAKRSGLFDYVAVSSDSQEILNVAKEYGADFQIMRPAEMATDKASKIPVMKHCAQQVEELTGKTFDVVVDLDCTSPLRNVEDIEGAVKLLEGSDASNVITAAPCRRSPYFNLVEEDDKGYVGLSKKLDTYIYRRQDSPKCYDMNASIYAWRRDALWEAKSIFLEKTKLFVMPEERSHDIDSELDFEIVEMLAKKRGEL